MLSTRLTLRCSLRARIFVAATATLAGCSGTSPSKQAAPAATLAAAEVAQQHVDAAQRLIQDQQYEPAVEKLTAALAVIRHDIEPVGRIQDASLDADILFQRGAAYLAMGFPDTAAADFTEVLRLRPDDGAAFARRGQAYVQLGDLYKAVRDSTEAIRYDAANALAYRYRGAAYLARGQAERAVADLEKAIGLDAGLQSELRPLLARAYVDWSRQLARADDAVAADAKLAKARDLDPSLVAATGSPAIEEPGDADQDGEPGAVTQTVAKQVVDDAQPRFDAGMERLAQGRRQDALIEFTAAVTIRPDFADAYLRRGQTLLALGFPDTAVKDLEQAVHFGGNSLVAYRLQAEAFLKLGSPHRAALAATDALHADPLDAASYILRGTAYVELGNWERAIVDLEQAVRLDATLHDRAQPELERAYKLRDAANLGAA
jgi:tetratricopeptide (TPR) repeat protein